MKNLIIKKCLLAALICTGVHIVTSQNIEWRSFNEDLLIRSKNSQKPILLHLSANWCHWCHVMEDITYQNQDVIDYINTNFIASTEDHDRRPDLANRYRAYGWPATIIFSPNGQELFKQAGYIPPNRFLEILKKIYTSSQDTNEDSFSSEYPIVDTAWSIENLKLIKEEIYQNIDLKKGGFNIGQKYLDFEMFEYAFNHREDERLKKFLEVSVRNALKLTDKVWGGVYQYSTHGDWDHPHYEKLLSIQARYIKMFLWYFYLTADSTYLHAAKDIYGYVNRFLRKEDGTFANAQDADLIKGRKAHTYYALSEKKRLKFGIPAIDTNAYSDNNARMIEALIYLYAITKTPEYLEHAIRAAEIFRSNYKRPDGLYNHGSSTNFNPALTDQIYLAKSFMLLFRATLDSGYFQEGVRILELVHQHFYCGSCMFSFKSLENYLKPTCVVSENIETARLFNLYGKILENEEWISVAKTIRNYLLTNQVYEDIFIEPGILTLHEEVETDPYMAVFDARSATPLADNLLLASLAVPRFYIFSGPAKILASSGLFSENHHSDYMDDRPFLYICTSSFCSSPLHTHEEIARFVRMRVLQSN